MTTTQFNNLKNLCKGNSASKIELLLKNYKESDIKFMISQISSSNVTDKHSLAIWLSNN